jgi:O-antigen/teichoic acid export membrane protein
MKNNKIIINYVWNIIYQFSVVVVPLITIPYVSRLFGAEGVGTFSSINGLSMFFYFLGILGVSNYGYKLIGSSNHDKTKYSKLFFEIYFIQVILSILSILSYVTIFLNLSIIDNQLFMLLSLPFVVSSIFDISWLFIGLEEMRIVSLRNLFIKIGGMILIFIFVNKPEDLWIYFLIQSASFLIGYIFLFLMSWKVLDFSQIRSLNFIQHIKEIALLSLPVLSIQVYTQFDRTLVMLLSDKANAGYYDQSLKMAKIINPFISSLSIAILPRISNLFFHKDNEQIIKLLGKSLRFTIIASIGLSGVVIAIAPQFVTLFFGNSFSNIVILVQIASVLIIVIPIGGVFANQVALPMNRTKDYIIPTVVGALINLTLGIILIPRFGAFGAIISIVITETLVFVMRAYLVKDIISVRTSTRECKYFIFIYVILLPFGMYLNRIVTFSLFVNTLIIGTLYCLGYILMVLFNPKYRRVIIKIIEKGE